MIACVAFFVVMFYTLILFKFILLPRPRGQPHTVLGGFMSVSGGWVLLCMGLVMAEDKVCTEQYVL